MKFGQKLKAERERAGLTQQQLADAVGIYRESIARIEAGTRGPAWKMVQDLARVLGVSTEVFQDDVAKPSSPAKGKGGKKRNSARAKPS